MKAKYEYNNRDGEWNKAVIDTDDIYLDNDSEEEWNKEDLEYHVRESHQQSHESIRNYEIV